MSSHIARNIQSTARAGHCRGLKALTAASIEQCTKRSGLLVQHIQLNHPPPTHPLLQVGIALGVTALAVGYVGRLASKAMAEVSPDFEAGEADKQAH